MPSYFYHLAIELFARPQSGLGVASQSVDYRSPTSLAFDSACEALLPFQKRARQSISTIYNSHQSRTTSSQSASATATTHPTVPHLYTKSPTSASDFENDLRLDKISIECVDMVPSEDESATASKGIGKRDVKNNPVATGIGTDILGGLRTKGKYIPLDQQTSDSIWGVVHLYRDAEETPFLVGEDFPLELKGSAAAARQPYDQLAGRQDAAKGHLPSLRQDEDCTTLCILAVPSYMSPSDFLGFVGKATMDEVSHFRMIRTARANRYMVLMKFRSGKKAMEWQKEWNGKVFNSMEPETCHVVFVKTVEIQAVNSDSNVSASQQSAPSASHVATSPQRTPISTSGQPSSIPTATLSSKPLAPPTPALIELPTCPVCLERMDETTGLLTILCQHVFHCTCLQKWKGSGCPVCRYTQDDFRRGSQGAAYGDEPAECSVCRSEINLWVCLICGNVGCGRYDGAHAFAHYNETSHAFAMDLASQRVWSYVGDAYVHRIIQSKTDGKLVELPAADNSALDPPDWTDAVPREKLENMSVEYTHLLTSQLESQRAYFEEIVERAADKASQAAAAASMAQETAEKATASLRALQAQYDKLAAETLPGLERDKARAEKRAEKFEAMTRKMEKEWREEKTMNESLMKRIEHLTTEVAELKAANADLTEQNRDLTFFISGSERLKDQGEDVVQGTVSVPDPPANNKRKGRGKGKK
ncbi:RING finger protein ETP1 homolog [Aspergillus udagawae]|uniref:RING finger protein ETP1 homolog n=1 Tax=Aspergillus udagawae TaxID=91492 RepID=A0ABQ1BCE1_9EURO|nr:RING finger protein ETP1 homolog [Aspergillus udagawae]GFF97846.1 RING finger protein ETP1 homolog [Aspergillus udagawae]GFG02896.1 RING finger protein ETP1 homolog [Aspergillus udagawae]GFG25034.1 RING finger protein ETP1 homolog [Aspergillus udagawae]